MRYRTLPLTVTLTVSLFACGSSGGEGGTGPSVDMSGNWSYSATIDQDTETCTVENAPMTVEQNGELIAGTIDMDSIRCGGAACGDAALDRVQIEFGRISGSQIEFEAFAFVHDGDVSANRMEGILLAERAEISGCPQKEGGTGTDIIESGPGTWQATR